MLKQGSLYTRRDLYDIFKVPDDKRKGGPWATGYLEHNGEAIIFANIGVAGRTGHDYNNHWENGILVWYGKTDAHVGQPGIKRMLEPGMTVRLFTRRGNRDPFTYHGLAVPKKVYKNEVPVKVEWAIVNNLKERKQVPVVKNEVNETTLSKNIKQAKNDDVNDRISRTYRRRRGQRKFYENLFRVCRGKCCITESTVKSVLHACHIIPHAQSGNNNTTNGLLLRSDIHDLFDKHLIGIDPITLKIHIKKELENTEYASLKGKILLPRMYDELPNKDALEKRWQLFNEKQ